MMRRSLPLALGLALGLAGTAGAQSLGAGISQNLTAAAALPLDPSSLPAASVRNGQEIFTSFRDGLAEPSCDAEATSPRWQKQFAHAPRAWPTRMTMRWCCSATWSKSCARPTCPPSSR